MSLVLGLDFETTGLSLEEDRIIEIGAALWDVELQTPIDLISMFVRPDNFKEIKPEITQINGITTEMIEKYGVSPKQAFGILDIKMRHAERIVAHNGSGFDRPFLMNELERNEFKDHSANKPWIDTKIDVPYPKHIRGRSLIHLAAEHGFLNPLAHRAVMDVLTMMKVFSHYDYNEIVKWADSETIHVVAMVSYEQREKAKNFGFRWNPGEKVWAKTMKAFEFDKEKTSYDFQVNTFTV